MADTTDRAADTGALFDFDRKRPSVVAPSRQADASAAAYDLLHFAKGRKFATILADPPWQFTNKTGKVAPEHKRLSRYSTLTLDEIKGLPVSQATTARAHLYL